MAPRLRCSSLPLPLRASPHWTLPPLAALAGDPIKASISAAAQAWRPRRRRVSPYIINGLFDFGNLMDEGVDIYCLSPRDVVLGNIQKIRPDVFILCNVNGSYGAPFFVTRFREVLFVFSSALFDMLDATVPRDNDQRLLVERDLFGRFALNVIACEGSDRVERHETYKQWQVRNHRAGLRQLPLDSDIVKVVRKKAKDGYHKDFVIDVDHQWILEGWKGRIIVAMSTWFADDASSTH